MGYSARQRKVNGSVFGANEIAKELKEMGESAKDILTVAAKAGGNIALQDAKEHCPVKTGALKNSLSIRVSKENATKAEITIEYDKSLRYGTFVELGVKGRKPNPFLRNAIDNNVDRINNAIVQQVMKGVDDKL